MQLLFGAKGGGSQDKDGKDDNRGQKQHSPPSPDRSCLIKNINNSSASNDDSNNKKQVGRPPEKSTSRAEKFYFVIKVYTFSNHHM